MTKATQAFFGNDSTGRAITVAQSVTGEWFMREYSFNGYAMAWTKWAVMPVAPTFKTKGFNQYSGEEYTIENGKVMEWGFSTLNKVEGKISYRLP